MAHESALCQLHTHHKFTPTAAGRLKYPPSYVFGLQIYNQTRIDHFRAFAGYWAVPATAETAMTGEWRKGPGAELFEAVQRKLGDAAPVIMAEDLGVITTDVKELRVQIGAPGMVVLQFAWGGGSDNTHLPHNHYANSFVYPGTHDNETSVGWYVDSATVRGFVLTGLGSSVVGACMQCCFHCSVSPRRHALMQRFSGFA